MSDSPIGGDPNRAAEFYKRRWRIGNPKRCESMRPRTASTSHSARIALWFSPVLPYNAWILTRFMAARRRESESRRAPYTLQLFTAILLYAAQDEF